MVATAHVHWDLGVCNFLPSESCFFKQGLPSCKNEYACKSCWDFTSDQERDLMCDLYGLCKTTRCWNMPKQDDVLCRKCMTGDVSDLLPPSSYDHVGVLGSAPPVDTATASSSIQPSQKNNRGPDSDEMDRVFYDVLNSFPTGTLQHAGFFAKKIMQHRVEEQCDAATNKIDGKIEYSTNTSAQFSIQPR